MSPEFQDRRATLVYQDFQERQARPSSALRESQASLASLDRTEFPVNQDRKAKPDFQATQEHRVKRVNSDRLDSLDKRVSLETQASLESAVWTDFQGHRVFLVRPASLARRATEACLGFQDHQDSADHLE